MGRLRRALAVSILLFDEVLASVSIKVRVHVHVVVCIVVDLGIRLATLALLCTFGISRRLARLESCLIHESLEASLLLWCDGRRIIVISLLEWRRLINDLGSDLDLSFIVLLKQIKSTHRLDLLLVLVMQTSYLGGQFLLRQPVQGVVLLPFLLILTAIILMGEVAGVPGLRSGCIYSEGRLELTLIILLSLQDVAEACVLIGCKRLKGRNV